MRCYIQCHMADSWNSRVASGYRKYLGSTVTVYDINSIELVVRENLRVFLCVFKASRLLSGEIWLLMFNGFITEGHWCVCKCAESII